MIHYVNGIIKMHLRSKFIWFILPWGILFSSFLINFIISYFADELYTGGLMSIYIYMFVTGIGILPQTFPFAIGFSARRIDYFLGTVLTFIIVSAVNGLGMMLLSVGEMGWFNLWGSELHFFNLPYWSEGSGFVQLWIYVIAFLLMFAIGFLISSIHRRLGKIGTYGFFVVISLVFTILSFVSTSNNWWTGIGNWLVDQSALEYSLWALPFIVISGCISYLLQRRAVV